MSRLATQNATRATLRNSKTKRVKIWSHQGRKLINVNTTLVNAWTYLGENPAQGDRHALLSNVDM